jgi:hypothetical protein
VVNWPIVEYIPVKLLSALYLMVINLKLDHCSNTSFLGRHRAGRRDALNSRDASVHDGAQRQVQACAPFDPEGCAGCDRLRHALGHAALRFNGEVVILFSKLEFDLKDAQGEYQQGK